MMDYFAVEGGRPLEGRVFVHGAKNSALPLLAATLLADGESVLHNCPDLTDISAALGILSGLGCRVRRRPGAKLEWTSVLLWPPAPRPPAGPAHPQRGGHGERHAGGLRRPGDHGD